ncbi:hypothetical protein ACNS7O_01195 [Haloferacaceae archaeon DSL9]
MDRTRFVHLSFLAFGLILLSFVIMGTTRIFLSADVARLLAAPTLFGAFVLVCVLFVRGLLDFAGLRPIEE